MAVDAAFGEFHFDRFTVSASTRQLLIDGEPAKLGARAFDLLCALIERRERVVPKSELLDLVWPDLIVEENNLQVHVSGLRKLIGPTAIATVPGRGYRFAAAVQEAPAAAPAPRPAGLSNLPADLGQLIGREPTLADLDQALTEHALVTLAGAGGIGKTRLALAAAHARLGNEPDGVWWVDLALLPTGAAADPVAQAVAGAVGLTLAAGTTPLGALCATLKPLSALVVLDNAEHVLDGAAEVVAAGLSAATTVRWLVTSQVPLKLPSEHRFVVDTLSVPPPDTARDEALRHGAMALLVRRAQAADHRFVLDDTALPAAIDVCRQLDGHPLAIEMAAARLAWLGAPDVQRRLADRFRLLASGQRGGPSRHQTLHAALDWSYALLSPQEQAVLQRLAVFTGGFTLEPAQAAAAGDDDGELDAWAVLDALAGLVDKSWVQVDGATTPRYRMLESARLYALEQLRAQGGEVRALARHAEAMGALADRHVSDFRHVDRAQWTAIYGPQTDNLCTAMDWALGAGRGDLAARLFLPISILLQGSARAQELAPRVDALRPFIDALPTEAQVRTQLAIGVARMAFSPRDAADASRVALALLNADQATPYDGDLRFMALAQAAQYLAMNGDLAEARALIDEAHALDSPSTPLILRFALANADFMLLTFSEQYEEALGVASRAIAWSETLHAERATALLRINAAACALMLARHDEAIGQLQSMLARCQGPSWLHPRAMALTNLVNAYCAVGDLATAQRTAIEALPLTRRAGYRLGLLENVAELASLDGRGTTAAQIVGAIEAAEARGGIHPQPDSLRTRHGVLQRLQSALGEEALGHWRDLGSGLNDDGLDALIAAPPAA